MSIRPLFLLLTPLAAFALTACSSTDEPPAGETSASEVSPTATATPDPSNTQSAAPTGASGDPRGGLIDPATVDTSDADQVADAVVTTMETADTRIDVTPMDASRRAEPWLTPQYLETILQPIPGGGGAGWIELDANDGYTTTTLSDATEMGQPEDTDTEAFRARAAATERLGADGWTGESTQSVYYVFLVRDSAEDPWLVDGIQIG